MYKAVMNSEEIKTALLGILVGDCSGSPYEGSKVTGDKIGAYTDDTEQAYGIALWLTGSDHSIQNLEHLLKKVYSGRGRGYGAGQSAFLEGLPVRKDSFGNGAAMRVAPVGAYGNSVEEVIDLAKRQCQLTHQHPEAIAGAITIALMTFLIKTGQSPASITKLYPESLLPEKDKTYSCTLKACESVPPAVEAFLWGDSFESTLKRALSYGGDTDTIAAMASALAAVRYGVPDDILRRVVEAHPDNKNMVELIQQL